MSSLLGSLTGQTAQAPQLNLGQTQGAQGAFGDIGGVQQWGSMGPNMLPYAQNTFNALYGNPFAGQAVGGALSAADMGNIAANTAMGVGGGQIGQGRNLFDLASGLAGPAYQTIGAGQSLYPAGQEAIQAGAGMIPGAYQIMQTGFDPQNALYSRTAQQVQDQVRAGEAARGIQTSPYGAGVEGNVMSNFNIDWQNNLLNRQAQAAGAAGGLLNQATGAMGTGAGIYGTGAGMGTAGAGMLGQLGSLFGTAGGLQSQGVGLMGQAPGLQYGTSQLPYQTQQGISSDQMNAVMQMLGYAGQGQGLAQTPFQDYMGIWGQGNQQQNIANAIYGNQIKQQQNQFQDMMSFGKGLGSMFGGMNLASMIPGFNPIGG